MSNQHECKRSTFPGPAGAMRHVLVPALLMLMLVSHESQACLAQMRPHDAQAYERILLGEVVSVRLTEYATLRAREIADPVKGVWYTDGTLDHVIEVLPLEVLKGSAGSGKQTISIKNGCGIPEPHLRQIGLFYIDATGAAVPVYQNDREYRTRLKQLNSRYAAPCANEKERRLVHPCAKPRQEMTMCVRLLDATADTVAPSCPGFAQRVMERLESEMADAAAPR